MIPGSPGSPATPGSTRCSSRRIEPGSDRGGVLSGTVTSLIAGPYPDGSAYGFARRLTAGRRIAAKGADRGSLDPPTYETPDLLVGTKTPITQRVRPHRAGDPAAYSKRREEMSSPLATTQRRGQWPKQRTGHGGAPRSE